MNVEALLVLQVVQLTADVEQLLAAKNGADMRAAAAESAAQQAQQEFASMQAMYSQVTHFGLLFS